MCFNIACFAFHSPESYDSVNSYENVFAYNVSRKFLTKVRHYIAKTAVRKIKHNTKIDAAIEIKIPE